MSKTRKTRATKQRKTRTKRDALKSAPRGATLKGIRFDAFKEIVMNNGKDMGVRLRAAINLIRDKDARVIPFLERLQRDGDDAQQLRATSALSRYRTRAERHMNTSVPDDLQRMNAGILDGLVAGTPEQRTKARKWLWANPSPTMFTPAQVHALISTINSDRDTEAQEWYLRALNGIADDPGLIEMIASADATDNTTHIKQIASNDRG